MCRPQLMAVAALLLSHTFAAHPELLLLFPALAGGLELCGLGLAGKSFNAGSVQQEPCVVFVSFLLGDTPETRLGLKFSPLGAVANEQNQIHSSAHPRSCLALAPPGAGMRAKGSLPSVFFSLLFLQAEGFTWGVFLGSLVSQTKPRGRFCPVVSEGSSLAAAPFAHFYTHKTRQNDYMQTSLFTTWRCGKTTLFNLNRFLDFNSIFIYITSALSVSCSFSSTHLPLHLHFMKILGFGHFCCCPAVV